MPPYIKNPQKYRCTACSAQIKTSFDAFLHPLLSVLVCRKCHDDYGTGDFSQFDDPDVGPGVDENGDDNYCRWCVDGGDLFPCGRGDNDDPDRCHYAFCTECIKRNCPEDPILSQENLTPEKEFKWTCYSCDPSKLNQHKKEAQEAILALSSRDLKRNSNTFSLVKDLPVPSNNSYNTKADNNSPRVDSDLLKERTKPREKEADKQKEIERHRARDRDVEKEKQRKDKEEQAAKAAEQATAKQMEAQATNSQKQQVSEDKEQRAPVEKAQQASREKAQQVSREKEQPASKEKEYQAPKDKEKQVSNGKDQHVTKAIEQQGTKSNEQLGAAKDNCENQRDKDRTRDRENSFSADDSQAAKKRRTEGVSSSSGDVSLKDIQKEPEACTMPPVAPPKPVESSLKRLSRKSATPDQPTRASKTNLSSSLPSNKAPPSKSYSRIQATLPTSVKVKLPPMNNNAHASEATRMNNVASKSRLLSKQLKTTNEQIRPTCKNPLNEIELKKRLEYFEAVKKACLKEIDSKFSNISEMFLSKELRQNRSILKFEIGDLQKPLQEFSAMVRDLDSLYHSQT